MRIAFLSALLICVPLPALAHGPFDGRWARDLADCEEDRPPTDIVPIVIDGDRIAYYESVCTMRDMTPIDIGEQVWRVRLACIGEGEAWDGGESIFAVERDEDGAPRRLVEIELGSGHVDIRENCDWPATGE